MILLQAIDTEIPAHFQTDFFIPKLQSWRALIEQHNVQELFIWIKATDSSPMQERTEQQIELYLRSALNISVEVFSLTNTHDFTQLVVQMDQQMHWLAMHEPFADIGFCATSMNLIEQAIVIEGIKTFEDRFHSLYANTIQHYHESVLQQSWLQLFQEILHEYDYKSAIELLEDAGLEHIPNVYPLLKMQYARLNFDFEEAKKCSAHVSLHNDLRFFQTKMILEELTGKESKEKATAQITELYRHTQIMLEKRDWSSFLTRFYRAREALLCFILQYGTEQQPTISPSIYTLIDQLEACYISGELRDYYGMYFYAKSANVAHTLTIRNKSFIGHSRASIQPKQMFANYYGTNANSSQMPKRFLADTKIMLREVNRDLDDNMAQMNRLILEQMNRYVEERAK